MLAPQQGLPSQARFQIVAHEQEQRGVAGRRESAMLFAAQATELRIVTETGSDALQDAVEEVRLERRREREHHQQLRIGIETVLTDDTAVRRAIVRRRQVRLNDSLVFVTVRGETLAEPRLERAFEVVEGVLQARAGRCGIAGLKCDVHEFFKAAPMKLT